MKEILKVLREADWEPSLHWKSMPTEFEHVLRNYPVSSHVNTLLGVSEVNFLRHMQRE